VAYAKDGYPTELANKVGHVKLIQDPMIQGMIEAFEDWRPPAEGVLPPITGHLDLDGDCPIEQVITVDGGHQAVPNIARPERQVGFVQIAAQLIKTETIESLNINRMSDPRKVRKVLNRFTHHTLAVLPLAGVHIPGLSVKQSIREAVHRFLAHYELYEALSYLVYRKWQTSIDEPPSMACLKCKALIELPRYALQFECSSCGEKHKLADYLGLCDEDAEERPRSETISNLRAVLEALVLFSFIIKFRDHNTIMSRTLFLLDGPLILRAQLSRLVEPIRALIEDQRNKGFPLYIVGVEKTGELRAFADAYAEFLKNKGDFFIPDTRFMVEEIHGRAFNESTYRNRVNYGAKIVIREGPDHVLVINIPTGEYLLKPSSTDLIGFEGITRSLSGLLSYSYENALIPIVLANAEASISNQPSGSILAQFIERILNDNQR
jgi:hypothetical protein